MPDPGGMSACAAAVEAIRDVVGARDSWAGKIELNILIERLRDTVARLLADATAAGAREVADWYRETFCPTHGGVTADETHARGDCAACNIAAAIRARATR